jgi:hypothetical protein
MIPVGLMTKSNLCLHPPGHKQYYIIVYILAHIWIFYNTAKCSNMHNKMTCIINCINYIINYYICIWFRKTKIYHTINYVFVLFVTLFILKIFLSYNYLPVHDLC